MIVTNSLVTKPSSELELGELFTTDIDQGFALCILVRRLATGRLVIAVLQGAAFEASRMQYVATDHLHRCLSFGMNWVLDLLPGQETFPQNTYTPDAASSIFLDTDAVVFRLDSDPRINMPRQPICINSQTFADHELSTTAAPVRNWRIWRTEQDRMVADAQPVFSFP
ncbi:MULTISPECIES: hypothetical protein [unclassified Mesorhizobium]|uniref:hypothetical protein n=1 Tax=unclassified Mesorhizobium TaxID=325217 RepID=UPI0012EC4B78|nr:MULTISPECIES: hypothetical protein [unclassified Mesorhizobium]WJI68956.1 hypothetical protein NLY36_29980 [Mesorhizobium sp. C399B]